MLRSLLLLLAFFLPAFGLHAGTIVATDADNRSITLNEISRISVVISSDQSTQSQTRATGQILDDFQGMKDFREMVLVDLQNSLGNLLPAFVRMQMRSNLDAEAKRIAPFFVRNGNLENPRLYTRAIPDFDGKLSAAVGWAKPQAIVQVVIFDRNGQSKFRWSADQNPSQLKAVVSNLLSK